MKRKGFSGRIIKLRLSLLIALAGFFITGCSVVPYTPAITDSDGEIIPGSVTFLEEVDIGGVKEWLVIRGKSINNPILLFIHGGPQLEAPKKEFLWFDNSAHSPMYEEADKFNNVLIEKIRPKILGK